MAKKKATVPEWQKIWDARVGEFANAVGKDKAEVEAALKSIAGDPSEQALAVLASDTSSPLGELRAALCEGELKVPTGVLRLKLYLLRGVSDTPDGAADGTNGTSPASLLPQVRDNSSLISELQVGGRLKVDVLAVESAAHAAFAYRTGMQNVAVALRRMIVEHADTLDLPVDDDMLRVLNRVTARRNYPEIFAGIDNAKGEYVTDKVKDAFISRVSCIWASLYTFHNHLTSWNDQWMEQSASPAVLAQAIGSIGSGKTGPTIQHPSTQRLISAAEAVNDDLNKAFRGFGLMASRAVSYDCLKARDLLQLDGLWQATGSNSQDHMLKTLRLDQDSYQVRSEMVTVQYMLAVINLPKVGPANEVGYLTEMLNVGRDVPWSTLVDGAAASSGRPLPRRNFDGGAHKRT